MNRLSREKSPYLLQHAGNLVDWYPWGDEAFGRARHEDKPVFLSIGYSTCHWCHVMERESFEDEQVASLLNEHFVCVKVDREERPDVDGVYMDAAVAMTGRGGWPLTIVMTAEGEPFFAATYIPRETRFGMPGMLELLPRLAELWRDRRPEILRTAASVKEFLTKAAGAADPEEGTRTTGTPAATDAKPRTHSGVTSSAERTGEAAGSRGDIGDALIAAAVEELAARFDDENGGFGGAPKFPSAHVLVFLMRRWRATGEERMLGMVARTLDAMRRGGIYDHVGFGFHRYSTDERWLVPHFEKMLYDQATLARAYAEAAVLTGDREYERTALEIIEYVLRDMRAPGGGFCSAEDADSEGVEGKFYLWTMRELEDALGEDAALAASVYGASREGNPDGTNVLHLERPLAETASLLGMSEEALREKLESIRLRLLEARAKRVRPGRDDKVLTDWNGLMISALAFSARSFGDDRCARAAVDAADLILTRMRDGRGRLLHRLRDGEAAIAAGADDYAFLVAGLLDLYDATLEPRWLGEAVALAGEFVEHFLDAERGGFYATADDAEHLIIRKREAHDGALPSANSVALMDLLRLSKITGDAALESTAAGVSRAFAANVSLNPSAHASLLAAVQYAMSPPGLLVVSGADAAEDTREMLDAIRQVGGSEPTVLLRTPRTADALASVAPWTDGLAMLDGRATAYLCHDRACERPTCDPREVAREIERTRS